MNDNCFNVLAANFIVSIDSGLVLVESFLPHYRSYVSASLYRPCNFGLDARHHEFYLVGAVYIIYSINILESCFGTVKLLGNSLIFR